MELSVVVSTLNDREQLLTCLDALADRTPSSTEVIVVNGPSSDGTTGAVRERADVDVLVEISERNPNVSRNAGLGVADGDTVAFLDGEYTVEPGWYDAIERSLETGSDVVAGPITGETPYDRDPNSPRTVAGRRVFAFDADNVAFDRTVLSALDGFDEYLEIDGERDCAHRIAGLGFDVAWSAEMAVRSEFGADGGTPEPEWGTRYRSITYRLAKNYGPRPTVLGRTAFRAVRDGLSGIRRVVSGDVTPTDWFSDGVDVVANAAAGNRDGLRARYSDRSARRNPNGLSSRHDRAVRVYDRREESET
ncbi:glycosyltransferase family 2 protein [Natrialba swarupiae]|uniref:Glycosyltransferase family 2 protein n=1 Tax=Natrialba swarupiae TaxID=2448032 RepID=A0A5D5AKG4_9EURY|nr:glycosyltransferase family A protein [Natrialba swarupiae]TYT61445.1 glycosyltransferase family 2 protein [Natrialba swarupiae]